MPQVNWDEVSSGGGDYTPLIDGDYVCKANKVEEKTTQKGDEMWSVEWEVCEGPNSGRKIFDNMVFSEAAMSRVKLICSRLGLPTEGTVNLKPENIAGRKVKITTYVEDYVNSKGETKAQNKVPFDGYTAVEGNVVEDDDDDLVI